jgi:hypothetical protein
LLEDLAAEHMDIEPMFGNIDSDKTTIHDKVLAERRRPATSTLEMRPSLRGGRLAQRLSGIDGRGFGKVRRPRLSHDLGDRRGNGLPHTFHGRNLVN